MDSGCSHVILSAWSPVQVDLGLSAHISPGLVLTLSWTALGPLRHLGLGNVSLTGNPGMESAVRGIVLLDPRLPLVVGSEADMWRELECCQFSLE